ncbi:MAG: enoyl-ACP reductase FabI [Chitinophagaceae bacterium]
MANQLLQGKKGIIFGALNNQSIAWKVALRCYEEGAQVVLTNAPVALKVGEIHDLSASCGNALVVPADVTSNEDIENLFIKTKEHFNSGVDFILHSVGMSMNMRKKNDYTNLNHDFMHKTFDISAMSLHRIMQTALKLDAINECGSVLALSYIAAQRVFPDYNEMADAKALLESIARSWGYQYGVRKKVRVNTISQSPTLTTAGGGVKGFNSFINFAEKMSPLGNADASDCANYCISLFSDLTKMVTMQNLFHDGGFSFTGVTPEVLQ